MPGEKHKHSDSIALTKSLLIAARWLFRAGLALSVIASQCHLSQGERLWHTRRLKNPLSEMAAPRGAGYLAKFQNISVSSSQIKLRQGGELRVSWRSSNFANQGNFAKLANNQY